jgi:hypothetical protein
MGKISVIKIVLLIISLEELRSRDREMQGKDLLVQGQVLGDK